MATTEREGKRVAKAMRVDTTYTGSEEKFWYWIALLCNTILPFDVIIV